jgi:hypothetical protein
MRERKGNTLGTQSLFMAIQKAWRMEGYRLSVYGALYGHNNISVAMRLERLGKVLDQ